MTAKEQLGDYILREARKSNRYWYSSHSVRVNILKNPMFDKNQALDIIRLYRDYGGETDEAEVA